MPSQDPQEQEFAQIILLSLKMVALGLAGGILLELLLGPML